MLALIAGCGDDDGISPLRVVGTWVYAGPTLHAFASVPDTIVIEGGGRGHVAMKRVHEQPPGVEPRYVVEWLRGPLSYRFGDDEVLFRWCVQPPEVDSPCPMEWHSRGAMNRDGHMMIGPTSPISSVAAQPWRRVGR